MARRHPPFLFRGIIALPGSLGLAALLTAWATPEGRAASTSPPASVSFSTSSAAPAAIPLWPDGAPGALGSADPDRPALHAFPAPKPNGAAAVICPGGAYGMLALEKEGFEVAAWLNSLGVSAFVLRYRVGPRYRHPFPVADAKRAMRWVRAHAGRYGVDPLRIGMVGFSAGGHLAATVATRYDGGRAAPVDGVDRFPCQPAFQVLVYPVITMSDGFTHPGSRRNLLGEPADTALVGLLSNERHVTAATPPAFLVHARTDPVVPFRNSEAYLAALRKAGVSAELAAYAEGTHAFGLARGPGRGGAREPSDWPERCARWLDGQGLLGPPAAAGRPGKPGERGEARPGR